MGDPLGIGTIFLASRSGNRTYPGSGCCIMHFWLNATASFFCFPCLCNALPIKKRAERDEPRLFFEIRSGVPPRQTQTDNDASGNPQRVAGRPLGVPYGCGVPPRQTREINAVRWSQVADRKNNPNRGIRRGRLLTSQTAFGGQLPYKGSLVRPVARFHHIPSEYNSRLLRTTSICHGIGYSHKSRRYALWASPTVSHTGDKILCGCMPHL